MGPSHCISHRDVPVQCSCAPGGLVACMEARVQGSRQAESDLAASACESRVWLCVLVDHLLAQILADGQQVGIKRRYNNVLVDADKQQQIEMFLGMKQDSFFPSLKLLYKVGGTWDG
eukprot:scaffold13497_cov20-Tisochrysis_lutea.AAC.2